jgi:hypothetical protein
MTEIDILCKAKEVYRRCFDDDYKYPGVLNAIRIAVEETNKECAKKDLEEWKVLEKNYDDLYERTRWHFPAKGELPEDCSRVLAIEKERSECRAGLYDYLESEDGEGQWEWLPRKIAVLSNDQILAWQYLPEEPQEEVK